MICTLMRIYDDDDGDEEEEREREENRKINKP
jgi:hypothetical protein